VAKIITVISGASCEMQVSAVGRFCYFILAPLGRCTVAPLLSDKMTSLKFTQAFGRIFDVESSNNQNRKEYYEYLDNFYWFYDPELDRKYGFKIKIQEVFENTSR
jgi:hypothetical protein